MSQGPSSGGAHRPFDPLERELIDAQKDLRGAIDLAKLHEERALAYLQRGDNYQYDKVMAVVDKYKNEIIPRLEGVVRNLFDSIRFR